MILRFEPSGGVSIRALLREVWDDAPLYIAPIVAMVFGVLLMTSDSYELGRGYAMFKLVLSTGLIPGALMLIAGLFKIASLIVAQRLFKLAVSILFATYLLFMVSALFSHVWAGAAFFGGFASLSIWGPFHVVPARRS